MEEININDFLRATENLSGDKKINLDDFFEEDVFWFNEESEQMLNSGYFLRGEGLFEAVDRICWSMSERYPKFRILAYNNFVRNVILGWQSFSSPIWSNTGTKRGLPISCFGVTPDDDMISITDKLSETIIQTKLGGGTSGYFGGLRAKGVPVKDNGTSSGSVSFMQLWDKAMSVVSQGSTRRGNFAAYLDIDHGDIEEFLNIKDVGNPIQNLFYGVNVPDWWMQAMIDGDMNKRALWARILQSRQEKGLPYILFSDTINRNKPEVYKELNETIWASNLCSEIALPSSPEESFVCCLSSMNLELYDDWKDSDAVYWAILFLDAVMSDFIEKTEGIKHMEATHRFAKRHRALGLGVMGYHSYLQKNMIPFESYEATRINNKIFKQIQDQAYDASTALMEMFGPAPIFDELKEKGKLEDVVFVRRNTTLMAIAPTTSSSSILGQVSPGIEPYTSNYYKVGLAKGNFMRMNKYLKKLLEQKGIYNEDTKRNLMLNKGSVQNIPELTPEEKAVFKTFEEISPMEIISQAAQRQKYIDQAQSLNLLIPSAMPVKDVNFLFVEAWQKGVKTLYYQRSTSVSKEMMTNFVLCNACEA